MWILYIYRLLSWGGKQIEPVGADYILHKLGFKHARTTIPKWIQRGVMDPSDIAVSFIVREMLKMMDEGSDEEKEKKKKTEASKKELRNILNLLSEKEDGSEI